MIMMTYMLILAISNDRRVFRGNSQRPDESQNRPLPGMISQTKGSDGSSRLIDAVHMRPQAFALYRLHQLSFSHPQIDRISIPTRELSSLKDGTILSVMRSHLSTYFHLYPFSPMTCTQLCLGFLVTVTNSHRWAYVFYARRQLRRRGLFNHGNGKIHHGQH